MVSYKEKCITAGFNLFQASRLHRVVAPLTRGLGAILMFHHVRPSEGADFAPNRLLEITPEFFDAVLTRVRALGFDIVTLDEALVRIAQGTKAHPFVVLTFDDGYRDNETYALPILEKHNAPFVLYVTSGFADHTARLWWVELERAIARMGRVEVHGLNLATGSAEEKEHAFDILYRFLRSQPEAVLLKTIEYLCNVSSVDGAAICAEECLDWDGIKRMAAHPLCTIGAHTLTHPMLAKHEEDVAHREISFCRGILQERTGQKVAHFAYPVGDVTSAGVRDFQFAREAGFASAVTTRPGMIFPEHADHLHALPRLSVNGKWQNLDFVEILLSGAPFALWNKGRRLNVG